MIDSKKWGIKPHETKDIIFCKPHPQWLSLLHNCQLHFVVLA